MDAMLLSVLLFFLQALNATIAPIASALTGQFTNVDCHPHVNITSTDPVHHRYSPYNIRVMRCQGADAKPSNRHCAPVVSEDVLVIVHDDDAGRYINITMANHTKCEMKCKINKSDCLTNRYKKWSEDRCLCDCDNKKNDTCEAPFVWNDHTEGCCACAVGEEDKCINEGVTLDPYTCKCVKANNEAQTCGEGFLTGKTLAIIIVLEFLIVVFTCSLVFYFCCYQRNIPLPHFVVSRMNSFTPMKTDSQSQATVNDMC